MQKLAFEGYRLSPQQQHLCSLQEKTQTQAFRSQAAIIIEGNLEKASLKASLDSLVKENEILRTTFRRLPEMSWPVQVISDVPVSYLREVNLTGMEGEQQRAIDGLLQEIKDQTFDIENGPLFRVWLAELSPVRWLLAISAHALCADSLTIKNIIRQILSASDEGEAEESDQPLQYADIAEWQNQLFESEDARAGIGYWNSRKFPTPEESRLLFEYKPSAAYEFNPKFIRLTLSDEELNHVEEFARLNNSSSSLIMLAVWQVLLWRLNGNPHITVGVRYDGRGYAEIESALGLFDQYLPVQASFDSETSFNSLIEDQKTQAENAAKWQECFSWDHIDALKFLAERQSFFSFSFDHDQWQDQYSNGESGFRFIDQQVCLEEFKIKLTLIDCGESRFLELHYNPVLFHDEDIEALAEQYRTLLWNAIAYPALALSELDITGQPEKDRLLGEFNPPAQLPSEYLCIHELFEEQARIKPDSVAVISEDHRLTYGELNTRANQLANCLRQHGVGPESVVALYLDRSVEVIISMLAVLKAGGAYLPLDESLPTGRLAFMLEDAGPTALVTYKRMLDRLPPLESKAICIDTDWNSISEQDGGNVANLTIPQNLAYVLFTSGSTGKPKAVMIEHHQLCSYVRAVTRRLPVSEGATFAMFSTFAADLGNTALFPSLLGGRCLHLISQERLSDPSSLADYLTNNPVDCMKIVPSHLEALHSYAHPERIMPRECLVLGGEASYWSWLDSLQWMAPDCAIVNHYGPTETTVGVLTHEAEKERPVLRSATVPLGRPLDGSKVHLLDSKLNLAPIWATGEIYIGGCNLSRGYLNNPDLTSERFLPDPFSTNAGERIYRTGDLARRWADGLIEFIGRRDHQIKIRGFRVEMGEIEAVIRQHPAVREVVVVAIDRPLAGKRIVAYVVPKMKAGTRATKDRQCELPNGLDVFYLNKYEVDYLYKEIFEERVYLRNGITVKDGDCVFDVGANIGLFSTFVAQQCCNATVYAFEPMPATFEILRLNAELSDIKIKPYNFGLSGREREATFIFNPGLSVCSGMYSSQYGGALETVKCQVRRLSDVIREQNIKQIDLLKIDVEKSELDVLEGIEDSDWTKIKQLVVEVHDVYGRLDYVISLLKDRNYTVTVEQRDDFLDKDVYNVYAITKQADFRLVSTNGHGEREKRESAVKIAFLESDLKGFLADRIPDYMLPSDYVLLDQLPLTLNGKVDRHSLPLPERANSKANESFLKPRDELEQKLVQIWEDVLGVRPIGIRDKFFELGGHSLLALRLMARINQQFGREVSLDTLIQVATVERLAELLRETDRKDEWSPLVALQPNGTKPPLFLVHPVTGNVLCYLELARNLGDDRPIYGLQARLTDPLTEVDQMAASYIEAIRTVQPHGPYLLGGWSMGGTIACEMALQLMGQGEEVPLLLLLDRRAFDLQNEVKDEATLQAMFVQTIETVKVQMIGANQALPDIHPALYYRLYTLFKTNYRALETYKQNPYPGKVLLFRAEDSVAVDPEISGGWNEIAPELEIDIVPGSHGSMLVEPHIKVLSKLLRKHLEAVSFSSTPSPASGLLSQLLNEEEIERLKAGLQSADNFVRRRCRILLAAEKATDLQTVAATIGCSVRTVKNAINAFHESGIRCLQRAPRAEVQRRILPKS